MQAQTQFENSGDLLINYSLLYILRSYGEVIVNDKNVPDWYIKQLGVKESERLSNVTNKNFVIFILISLLKRGVNVYLFSGLGHFGGDSITKAFKNFICGFIYMSFRILGATIVKLGTSIGDISRILAVSESFRAIFITYYLIRDSISIEKAHNIGIKKAKF